MIILFKRIAAFAASLTFVISAAAYVPDFSEYNIKISAAASSTTKSAAVKTAKNKKNIKRNVKITAPKVSCGKVYADKIVVKIDNIEKFTDKALFEIKNGSNVVKTVSARSVKKYGGITIRHNGKNYLTPSKTYVFKIRTKTKGGKYSSAVSVKAKTASKNYYKVKKGTVIYKKVGTKLKTTGKKASETLYFSGSPAFSSGKKIAGMKISQKAEFVCITSGELKGKYVKLQKTTGVSARDVKIDKVVKYAVGMNGGSYVWGGERYRATDCSGLTMLSYKQVGVNITHSAANQARMGKTNTLKNVKKGDVLICNGGSHAALYIGGGKIIHAMSPSYGIRIQHISMLSYVGPVTAVRTII